MIDNVSYLFGFLGGLGLFLYGMHIMADGMQKTAGGKMQQFLSKITDNRFTAILLGAVITAIIQSSGATTVMVVGFVSAGMLSLVQAVGVIRYYNYSVDSITWNNRRFAEALSAGILRPFNDWYRCDIYTVFKIRQEKDHR